MSTTLKGGCLCGAVTYETAAQPQIVGHCYCVDCRRSSGTGHGTHAAVPEDTLNLNGEVKLYDHPRRQREHRKPRLLSELRRRNFIAE